MTRGTSQSYLEPQRNWIRSPSPPSLLTRLAQSSTTPPDYVASRRLSFQPVLLSRLDHSITDSEAVRDVRTSSSMSQSDVDLRATSTGILDKGKQKAIEDDLIHDHSLSNPVDTRYGEKFQDSQQKKRKVTIVAHERARKSPYHDRPRSLSEKPGLTNYFIADEGIRPSPLVSETPKQSSSPIQPWSRNLHYKPPGEESDTAAFDSVNDLATTPRFVEQADLSEDNFALPARAQWKRAFRAEIAAKNRAKFNGTSLAPLDEDPPPYPGKIKPKSQQSKVALPNSTPSKSSPSSRTTTLGLSHNDTGYSASHETPDTPCKSIAEPPERFGNGHLSLEGNCAEESHIHKTSGTGYGSVALLVPMIECVTKDIPKLQFATIDTGRVTTVPQGSSHGNTVFEVMKMENPSKSILLSSGPRIPVSNRHEPLSLPARQSHAASTDAKSLSASQSGYQIDLTSQENSLKRDPHAENPRGRYENAGIAYPPGDSNVFKSRPLQLQSRSKTLSAFGTYNNDNPNPNPAIKQLRSPRVAPKAFYQPKVTEPLQLASSAFLAPKPVISAHVPCTVTNDKVSGRQSLAPFDTWSQPYNDSSLRPQFLPPNNWSSMEFVEPLGFVNQQMNFVDPTLLYTGALGMPYPLGSMPQMPSDRISTPTDLLLYGHPHNKHTTFQQDEAQTRNVSSQGDRSYIRNNDAPHISPTATVVPAETKLNTVGIEIDWETDDTDNGRFTFPPSTKRRSFDRNAAMVLTNIPKHNQSKTWVSRWCKTASGFQKASVIKFNGDKVLVVFNSLTSARTAFYSHRLLPPADKMQAHWYRGEVGNELLKVWHPQSVKQHDDSGTHSSHGMDREEKNASGNTSLAGIFEKEGSLPIQAHLNSLTNNRAALDLSNIGPATFPRGNSIEMADELSTTEALECQQPLRDKQLLAKVAPEPEATLVNASLNSLHTGTDNATKQHLCSIQSEFSPTDIVLATASDDPIPTIITSNRPLSAFSSNIRKASKNTSPGETRSSQADQRTTVLLMESPNGREALLRQQVKMSIKRKAKDTSVVAQRSDSLATMAPTPNITTPMVINSPLAEHDTIELAEVRTSLTCEAENLISDIFEQEKSRMEAKDLETRARRGREILTRLEQSKDAEETANIRAELKLWSAESISTPVLVNTKMNMPSSWPRNTQALVIEVSDDEGE